jgi:hypothetical protein
MKKEYKKFVVGETLYEAINKLPAGTKERFAAYSMQYGIEYIEPELEGLEAALWVTMRDLIDNTRPKRGGQRGNSNAEKTNENESIQLDSIEKTNENESKRIKTNENESGNLNLNDNDNLNENVNVNEKENENIPASSEAVSPEMESALLLAETILEEHRKEFSDYLAGKDKQVIPRWAVDIEKLIRIDKKAPENIRDVILWVKRPGNFWFHNIESGAKLRKQFERLFGQMKTEKTGPPSPAGRIANDNVDDVSQYFTEV